VDGGIIYYAYAKKKTAHFQPYANMSASINSLSVEKKTSSGK
jgi:hypothetical protein